MKSKKDVKSKAEATGNQPYMVGCFFMSIRATGCEQVGRSPLIPEGVGIFAASLGMRRGLMGAFQHLPGELTRKIVINML